MEELTQIWDAYHCPNCGGIAPLGLYSLIARCEKCPFVFVPLQGMRGWYSSAEFANEVYAEKEKAGA
jgi:hypothetical protein